MNEFPENFCSLLSPSVIFLHFYEDKMMLIIQISIVFYGLSPTILRARPNFLHHLVKKQTSVPISSNYGLRRFRGSRYSYTVPRISSLTTNDPHNSRNPWIEQFVISESRLLRVSCSFCKFVVRVLRPWRNAVPLAEETLSYQVSAISVGALSLLHFSSD